MSQIQGPGKQHINILKCFSMKDQTYCGVFTFLYVTGGVNQVIVFPR